MALSFFKIKALDGIVKPIRKSIYLVLLGNFMEYWDLMLGVHMSSVLSKVFLPVDDEYSAITRAATFVMPLCLRPIATVFWGWYGDKHGRVKILSYTMVFTASCCFLLTILPSYAQWGMASMICFFLLRGIQSVMATGENGAADVYITELVKAPQGYFVASLVEVSCTLGGFFACLVAALSMFIDPLTGWKIAFGIGSTFAFLGAYIRKNLKETSDFIAFSEKREADFKKIVLKQTETLKNSYVIRNIASCALIHVYVGMFFYVKFAFFTSVLEESFGLSSGWILINSACLLLLSAVLEFGIGLLSLRVHPMKIVKVLHFCGIVFCLLFSMLPNLQSSIQMVIFLQAFFYIFALGVLPTLPNYIKTYSINKRMKSHMGALTISKTIIYLFTAYICVLISDISVILLIMAGAATVSFLGAFLFKAPKLTPLEEACDDAVICLNRIEDLKKNMLIF